MILKLRGLETLATLWFWYCCYSFVDHTKQIGWKEKRKLQEDAVAVKLFGILLVRAIPQP